MALMAAGRAFPVARQMRTPALMAARRASTDDGSTLLLLSSSVPEQAAISFFKALELPGPVASSFSNSVAFAQRRPLCGPG